MVLMVMFTPLERLFAMHRQPIFRREWKTDLLFFLGQYFLWTTPVVSCLVAMRWVIETLPLFEIHSLMAAWPWWLVAVTAIFLSDLSIYWGHRLAHRVPFLWRFHKVHHTSVDLDWLAAHREHPLDNLYTRAIENLPLILLGFPIETIAGFIVFRGLWGHFIHANISMKLGPLKYILGSSHLHHWHHSMEKPDCNYANLMPVMDLLFGTYHHPLEVPLSYGIDENVDRGYINQMVAPLTVRGLSPREDSQSDQAQLSTVPSAGSSPLLEG